MKRRKEGCSSESECFPSEASFEAVIQSEVKGQQSEVNATQSEEMDETDKEKEKEREQRSRISSFESLL
jgi:hypothetical protein